MSEHSEQINQSHPYDSQKPLMIVVMGPASCGKSTIGEELSKDLKVPFIDGDSLHPEANVVKMSTGHPLTDADRLPWLLAIRKTGIMECRREFDDGKVKSRADGGLGRPVVIIACSALKKRYRDILRGTVETVQEQQPKLRTLFVYCKGSPDLLAKRIASRQGHFMKPDMLASQLATLEDPEEEGGVVTVDISKSRSEVRREAHDGVKKLLEVMDNQGV